MNLRKYFERGRRDAEFASESDSYIAHEIDDNIARGMTPERARAEALRKFGNVTSAREAVHDMNTIAWFDAFAQNLRFAVRQLRLQPGFALTAVLSLALGIGANTAIFTLFDQVMLRLLPVPNPKELVQLRVAGGRFGSNSGDGLHTFSYPAYRALRDANTVFAGLTGQREDSVSLTSNTGGEVVPAGFVAGNFFDVFGVQPHAGRLLTPGDDREGAGNAVAVLQYDFWRTRYEGRPEIVGQTIRVNGVPFQVIGVSAPGFQGTDTALATKMWMPIAIRATVLPTLPTIENERYSWFYVFGRLKPGIAIEQAQSSMRITYRQRQEEELKMPYFAKYPQSRERFLRQTFSLAPAGRGDSFLRFLFARPLEILQWLVAAVLLIACANVAGLLVARGAARQRELAIRGAIGAGRGRLIGQLLTESMLLAAMGGLAGVALGAWLARGLLRLLPFDPDSISLSAAPDFRILLFAFAITSITAVAFGLLPAFRSSRVAPALAMREASGAVSASHSHAGLRKFFVAVQVALSVLLLVGAGLFVRTLRNLRWVDLGIATENVVTFSVRPAENYDEARKLRVYRQLVESLARVPGVQSVGANRFRLFTGGRADGGVTIPGHVAKNSDGPTAFFNEVTPGYFAALGIPIKLGRDVDWRDWGSGRKLGLVNEKAAKQWFGDASPVGRMIGRGGDAKPEIEIVGVFGDSRYHEVRGAVPEQLFSGMDGHMARLAGVNVYARVTGDPRQAMPLLRAETARVDPNFVVADMRTLDDQIDTRLANERMVSLLSAAFAVLAVALAAIGLYGVLAFVVARRTREIGLRIALGARRGQVIGMVAGEMGLVIIGGLIAGLSGAYAAGRFVQSQLFGVDAKDPATMLAAALALLAAAGCAAVIPAWRASRIDPMRALRPE